MNRSIAALFVTACSAGFFATSSAVAQFQGRPWLNAPVVLEQQQGSIYLLGDVDLDGDVDAIAFDGLTSAGLQNRYIVMRNDGHGNFSPDVPVLLPDGVRTEMGFGDFDGDGRGDMVVEITNSSALGAGLLFFSGQPDGSFANYGHVALPGNVLDLDVGNGNGDGIDDVFVYHATATYPSQSRWAFGALGSPVVLGPATASTAYADRTLLDANGDGLDDVAFVEGGFLQQNEVVVEVTTANGFVELSRTSVPINFLDPMVATDFDQDGDEDLVACYSDGSASMSLLAMASQGNGTFTTSVQTFAGRTPGHLHAADWDQDGLEDLVLRTNNAGTVLNQVRYVALLRNLGQGQYDYRYGQRIRGKAGNWGAGTADLNLDGLPDFVDSDALVFGDGTARVPNADRAGPVLLDWDRDGDLDAFDEQLWRNDGSGATVPDSFALPDPGPNRSYGSPQVIMDIEGDGLQELLVALREWVPFQGWVLVDMRILRQTVDMNFADAGPAAAAGQEILAGVVDDADDDGNLDIIDRQGVWLGDGAGFFVLTSGGFAGYQPIDKADVDGDGDQDLLATTTTGGTSLAVLHRIGPASYSTSVLFPQQDGTVYPRPHVRFADVDDDGDLDVAGEQRASTGLRRVLVFTNQGGSFSLAATIDYGGAPLVADFDGDGLTDLAVSGERTQIFRRTGPGLVYAPPVTFAAEELRAVADIDQDGDLDAIGYTVVRNQQHVQPTSGGRRQYGQGSLGAGNRRPILSVTGVLRENEVLGVRLRNVPGGAVAVLLIGTGENDAPSVILPGVQAYVAGLYQLLTLSASGSAGAAGQGSVDLPVGLPVGAAGLDLFLQCLVFDSASSIGLTYSNGCQMTVGG